MDLLRVVTCCFMLAMVSHAERKYGYSECVYNVYKAACLGTQISKYSCSKCNLRQFPRLTNYENCVLLKGNAIARFPDSFDNIRQLITLDLSENRLEQLPDNLYLLDNLKILDISKNRITILSTGTRFPVSLRGLMLAGNEMTTIPDGISVPGLFVLDLSNNDFTEIPAHICVSNELIRIDFTNNPLKGDLSTSIDVLNKCRNVHGIPYCVYTDSHNYKCDCDSLPPVLLEQPSFCMGNNQRNQPMTCTADSSSQQYSKDVLYELSSRTDFIRTNCSYSLKSTNEGAPVSAPVTMTVIASLGLSTTTLFFSI